MAATDEQQDGSKTLVSFVVGLLIGGMLVWAFSGPSNQLNTVNEVGNDEEAGEMTEAGEESEGGEEMASEEPVAAMAPTLPVGDGSVIVNDQPASAQVTLERATYPIEEGWIGVRDFNNGQLGFIKGVVRFSAAAGVVPENIILQDSMRAGQQYAVVVFSDNGDNAFNPAGDVQIDQIFATFTAQ
ncbi:MAG: hypothetical protein ACI9SY_000543 [Candidatus Paceibacteria bacterium]|jgi:hypothetical protein